MLQEAELSGTFCGDSGWMGGKSNGTKLLSVDTNRCLMGVLGLCVGTFETLAEMIRVQ